MNSVVYKQDCPAGLNFSNVEEADNFKSAINEKLNSRQRSKPGKLAV